MIDETGLELLRGIDRRCVRIEEKLDVKAEKEDVEKLELRVRANEKTLVKHKTIGTIVAAMFATLFSVFK